MAVHFMLKDVKTETIVEVMFAQQFSFILYKLIKEEDKN